MTNLVLVIIIIDDQPTSKSYNYRWPIYWWSVLVSITYLVLVLICMYDLLGADTRNFHWGVQACWWWLLKNLGRGTDWNLGNDCAGCQWYWSRLTTEIFVAKELKKKFSIVYIIACAFKASTATLLMLNETTVASTREQWKLQLFCESIVGVGKSNGTIRWLTKVWVGS